MFLFISNKENQSLRLPQNDFNSSIKSIKKTAVIMVKPRLLQLPLDVFQMFFDKNCFRIFLNTSPKARRIMLFIYSNMKNTPNIVPHFISERFASRLKNRSRACSTKSHNCLKLAKESVLNSSGFFEK